MDMFQGFETVNAVGDDAVQIVYGVNVVRVDAEVSAARTSGTVGELVEEYRERLSLPSDAVVFVDGAQVRLDDDLPAGCRRVEIVKPAGVKGAGDNIPLDPTDAARIDIVRRDEIVIVAGRDTEYVQIGAATRRADGSVTLDELVDGALEAYVNGEDWSDRPLQPDDHVVVVVPGETREITMAHWQTAKAHEAEADLLLEEVELGMISFTELRARARDLGIVAGGAGRTRIALTADLLAAERERLYEAISAGPPQPPEPELW